MEFKKATMPLTELPFDLDEKRWGVITMAWLEAPGVYYLAAVGREYYAALKGEAEKTLSPTALRYGREAGDVLLFPLDGRRNGGKIVEYELLRRAVHLGGPVPGESLLSRAVFGAEEYPDYFGPPVPPAHTPRGAMTRYIKLDEGIFLVETDTLNVLLAASYPIWDAELQESVQKRGEQTEYDRAKGIDRTLGWLFFPRELAAAPLYELLQSGTHNGLKRFIKSAETLTAAVGRYWPEYAVQVNLQEQAGHGLGNAAYHLAKAAGIDAPELEQPPQDFIPLFVDGQDTDFLKLPDSWRV